VPAARVGLSGIRERLTQPDTVRVQLVRRGRPREVVLKLQERL